MASHVAYELRMWQWSGNRLAQFGQKQLGTPERNAVIESYLLHLRNLIEFFRSDGTRSDDVVALNFAPNWALGDHAPVLERAWISLNKRLNHITSERLNKAAWPTVEKSWQRAHDTVAELWLQFETELDDERRAWFHPDFTAS